MAAQTWKPYAEGELLAWEHRLRKAYRDGFLTDRHLLVGRALLHLARLGGPMTASVATIAEKARTLHGKVHLCLDTARSALHRLRDLDLLVIRARLIQLRDRTGRFQCRQTSNEYELIMLGNQHAVEHRKTWLWLWWRRTRDRRARARAQQKQARANEAMEAAVEAKQDKQDSEHPSQTFSIVQHPLSTPDPLPLRHVLARMRFPRPASPRRTRWQQIVDVERDPTPIHVPDPDLTQVRLYAHEHRMDERSAARILRRLNEQKLIRQATMNRPQR